MLGTVLDGTDRTVRRICMQVKTHLYISYILYLATLVNK
jgi:hypothetical protein